MDKETFVYIVVEYWDETNGYTIKGVFDNEVDAKKCEEKKNTDRRWIEDWKIGQEAEDGEC